MSLTLSWVAVRGVGPEQALAALGMEVADVLRYEDIGWGDNVVLGPLPGGWLLAVSGDSADAFEGQLEPLTKLGPAIAGEISEIVMVSEARGYADGVETWRVVHDPEEEESLYALKISGNPPSPLDAIVRKARTEQDAEGGEEADVDIMIEIPGRLSHSICGYMPGEHEPDGVDFSELRPIGGNKQKPEGRAASSPACLAGAKLSTTLVMRNLVQHPSPMREIGKEQQWAFHIPGSQFRV